MAYAGHGRRTEEKSKYCESWGYELSFHGDLKSERETLAMLKRQNCQLTDLNVTFLSVIKMKHGFQTTSCLTGLSKKKALLKQSVY